MTITNVRAPRAVSTAAVTDPPPSPDAGAKRGPDGLPVGTKVPVPDAPGGSTSPAAGRIGPLLGQLAFPTILVGFMLKTVASNVNLGGKAAPRIPFFSHIVPRSLPGTAAVALAAGGSVAWAADRLLGDDGRCSGRHVEHGAALAGGVIGVLGGVAALRANAIGQAAAVPHGMRVLAGGIAFAAATEIAGGILDRQGH